LRLGTSNTDRVLIITDFRKGETMNEFTGIKCPDCGKKGLRYADHPHAYGWKNYNKINCRYCGVSHRTPNIPPGKTLREVLLSQQAATNTGGDPA
jgi:DNA-directed RNA polymerase subunit RPC12/RpoP